MHPCLEVTHNQGRIRPPCCKARSTIKTSEADFYPEVSPVGMRFEQELAQRRGDRQMDRLEESRPPVVPQGENVPFQDVPEAGAHNPVHLTKFRNRATFP